MVFENTARRSVTCANGCFLAAHRTRAPADYVASSANRHIPPVESEHSFVESQLLMVSNLRSQEALSAVPNLIVSQKPTIL